MHEGGRGQVGWGQGLKCYLFGVPHKWDRTLHMTFVKRKRLIYLLGQNLEAPFWVGAAPKPFRTFQIGIQMPFSRILKRGEIMIKQERKSKSSSKYF